MAPLGADAGSLEPGRTAADDVDLLGPRHLHAQPGSRPRPTSALTAQCRCGSKARQSWLIPRQPRISSRRPVCDFTGRSGLAIRARAMPTRSAWPALIACSAGGDVADALADEGGDAGRGANPRRRRDRNGVGTGGVLDVLTASSVGDAEVVDAAKAGKVLGDPHAVLDVHATGDLLLAAEPDAQREARRR